MRFTKMHGLGNDFVVVGPEVAMSPELVTRLCDRRFGVGADGVLAVSKPGDRVRMEYWNADGSEAEMCGNGLRCVARHAVDSGLVDTEAFVVDTPAGPKRVIVRADAVSVELGPVRVESSVVIEGFDLMRVDVGNPHAVALADPERVDLAVSGPAIEHDPLFPNGTNVEFFKPVSDTAVTMRVWERGVGETLACGTGMVAVAAAARASGHVNPDAREVSVTVPGGMASVSFGDGVWLIGPALTVFEGVWLSEPS